MYIDVYVLLTKNSIAQRRTNTHLYISEGHTSLITTILPNVLEPYPWPYGQSSVLDF